MGTKALLEGWGLSHDLRSPSQTSQITATGFQVEFGKDKPWGHRVYSLPLHHPFQCPMDKNAEQGEGYTTL